jgi:hypothetical protein
VVIPSKVPHISILRDIANKFNLSANMDVKLTKVSRLVLLLFAFIHSEPVVLSDRACFCVRLRRRSILP